MADLAQLREDEQVLDAVEILQVVPAVVDRVLDVAQGGGAGPYIDRATRAPPPDGVSAAVLSATTLPLISCVIAVSVSLETCEYAPEGVEVLGAQSGKGEWGCRQDLVRASRE